MTLPLSGKYEGRKAVVCSLSFVGLFVALVAAILGTFAVEYAEPLAGPLLAITLAVGGPSLGGTIALIAYDSLEELA